MGCICPHMWSPGEIWGPSEPFGRNLGLSDAISGPAGALLGALLRPWWGSAGVHLGPSGSRGPCGAIWSHRDPKPKIHPGPRDHKPKILPGTSGNRNLKSLQVPGVPNPKSIQVPGGQSQNSSKWNPWQTRLPKGLLVPYPNT